MLSAYIKYPLVFMVVAIPILISNRFLIYRKVFEKQIESVNLLMPKCILTKFEDNELEKNIHLGILGHVFDVSTNEFTYGANGSYNFFTGIDGSRAFATGDFSKEGLVNVLDGLTDNEIAEVINWLVYFGKEYKCVGYINGIYFDIFGVESDFFTDIKLKYRVLKDRQAEEEKLYPGCNMERSGEDSKVFCPETVPQKYPRLLRLSGTTNIRCVCANLDDHDPRLKMYKNCDKDSDNCIIS